MHKSNNSSIKKIMYHKKLPKTSISKTSDPITNYELQRNKWVVEQIVLKQTKRLGCFYQNANTIDIIL